MGYNILSKRNLGLRERRLSPVSLLAIAWLFLGGCDPSEPVAIGDRGEESLPPTETPSVPTGEFGLPGRVTDVGIEGSRTTYSSVTLSFTQVDDGSGSPANYDVRYIESSIGGRWGEASSVGKGSCATPLQGTTVGEMMTCSVNGLQASTSYDFQLVAYRGTLNQGAVFGQLSNIATAVTAEATIVIDVTPSAFEITEGETQQLTANVADVYGNPVEASVSWSTSSSTVATVDTSGLVSGQVAGGATIQATADGTSDTSDATVTASSTSSGDDGSASGRSAPAIDVDFDGYADTQALRADCGTQSSAKTFRCSEDASLDRIFLDAVTAPPGHAKSMWYDYRPGDPKDFTIGRSIFLEDHEIPQGETSLWVELYMRWSSNFTTNGPEAGNCDHKTFFIVPNPDNGRPEYKVGNDCNLGIQVGVPDATNQYDAGDATALWDERWHRIRFHVDFTTKNATAVKFWVDGSVRVDDVVDLTADSQVSNWDFLWFLKLGANLNKGSDRNMSIWWGSIRAWTQDPGW